jgi:hypothetical protein
MTTPTRALAAAPRGVSQFFLALLWALFATLFALQAVAQAPAASGGAAPPPAADELEKLVGPIALYPDDLVGIILPASTNPLQIVQADRFLETRKKDPKAPVDEKWDDAVKSLLNYPEVVKKMSNDLDWTSALGEAVVADSGEVMAAVQAFRRKVNAAGNLKTDEKQKVVVEQEIIKIEQANPEVIYVPQYNPSTVVVYGAPAYPYYPSPYPVYYYPYAPGAAFAAGIVWGAAMGAIWSGGHYGCGWGGNEININRNTNINVDRGDRTNINTGNRPSQQGGGSQKWQSNKKPGQVSSSVGKTPSTRVGDSRGGAAGGARPSTQQAGAAGRGGAGGPSASTRDVGGGAGAASRDAGGGGRAPSATPTSASRGGGSAFDGGGSSARSAQANSSRGASSRSSMSGGGGGARGGGGGRGGGRR